VQVRLVLVVNSYLLVPRAASITVLICSSSVVESYVIMNRRNGKNVQNIQDCNKNKMCLNV
jgi:hypothetical protein